MDAEHTLPVAEGAAEATSAVVGAGALVTYTPGTWAAVVVAAGHRTLNPAPQTFDIGVTGKTLTATA